MIEPLASHLSPPVMPCASRRGGLLVRAAVLATLSVTALACGKKETPAQDAAPAKASAQESRLSDAELDREISQVLEAPVQPQSNPVPNLSLADEAESILDRHPDLKATDLLNLPEVNESLKAGLTKLGQDKKLQGQINSSVELAAQMKGLEGKPGSVGLDLNTDNYTRDQKSRMLQAVLSEDPRQIVNFVVGEVGEAAPELSYGGADRASNGVAIKEITPPSKPGPAAQDD